MYLLIAGSRSITHFSLFEHIPAEVTLIISGGADGIDCLAEQYADEHKLSKLILRPQYNRYKKAAPIKRNEQMVEWADAVLVIWDGKSRGTKHTIDYAKKLGKPVTVVLANEAMRP